MRFKIVCLGAGVLISSLLWGEDTENLEADFEGEESETVTDSAADVIKDKKTYSVSLVKNSPFIPFKASKDALSSVESSDLEFLSVIDYATSKYSFCLKDKRSGKSFWLHSDGSDENNYGVIFYQYDPGERTLIVQNDEGELVSMVQQKPNLNPSNRSNSWSNDSYAELLQSLDDDDDED